MCKRILILKACGNSDEPHECNGICEQAQLYGIEHVCKKIKDNNEPNHGTLTLHLIKIVSEELLIIRLIPYLCCLKEEKADRKGNLFRGRFLDPLKMAEVRGLMFDV